MSETRSQMGEERLYPIGIQTFSEIREQGYVYVDKTAYVWHLTHGSGKYVFLSRPRRFGKSLLISTLQAYFEGRRELFEGLAIAERETDWIAYPVIRLDLSTIKTTDVGELREQLDRTFRDSEQLFGRDPADVTFGSRLAGLIDRASRQAGKAAKGRAVVLIDEYDAPLLNVVHDPELLAQFRQVMRELYAPLKSRDAELRFVMLTGITKFSQLSIFSELNNLKSISMLPEYAGVCGITEEELTTQLAPDVEVLASKAGLTYDDALAQLKQHYDGYHFCEGSPDVYNPYSLLNAFDDGAIKSYWFSTGTPTFVVELMRRYRWDVSDLEGREADEAEFDAPAGNASSPLPVLYQAGYLTIKGYDPDFKFYTLGFPNAEVRLGLLQVLAPYYLSDDDGANRSFLRNLARTLAAGRLDDALEAIRAYLAGIPYDLSNKTERDFQTMVYLVLDLLGVYIHTEVKTATGRIDALVETPGIIYVMEFKRDASAREALDQIDLKGYAMPYSASGKRLVKVGVNFSPEQRTIDEWLAEEAGVA